MSYKLKYTFMPQPLILRHRKTAVHCDQSSTWTQI